MDKILPPKPWYSRYRYHIMGGMALLALIVYAIVLSAGPSRLRIDGDLVKISDAQTAPFLEYVDVEGLVQPIRTLRVNSREAGNVMRIAAEEGQTVHAGDTLLVLSNPDLEQAIEDQRDDLARQQTNYAQQRMEQEKLRLNLRKQALQTGYEQKRLEKNISLEREEHRMGIRSKAQLEVDEEEYRYQQKRTELDLLSLQNDSAAAVIRSQMLERDLHHEQKKYIRSQQRLDNLVVVAPCDGQLSYMAASLGQHVNNGELIAEIKVMTDVKVHASLNEYYIDRITSGLPASIKYQNEHFGLHISKVVPEVRNRQFDVDLVFENDRPSNIRVGKSYRVQIELGKAEEVLVIPRGDFYQSTGGRWIYRLDESGRRAIKTPIVIGRQNPGQYEIVEGLQPDDRVITSGYEHLGETDVIVLK